MKKLLIQVYQQLKILNRVGFLFYLKYLFKKRGSKLNLIIDDYEIIIRKGSPDLDVAVSSLYGEYDILKFLFPTNYSGTILDAGGYIGTSSIALRKLYPKAKIIVIEPSKNNLSILKENLKFMSNIEIVYGALIGTSEKVIDLKNRGTGEWGYSIAKTPNDNPMAETLHQTPAYRLSDLINMDEQIGLIKLDIEGGEYSLFENDIEFLKSIPVVFAELHDRIVPGCTKKFFDFSNDRILIKDKGEKYISIKKGY